jgi:hypothetical protein
MVGRDEPQHPFLGRSEAKTAYFSDIIVVDQSVTDPTHFPRYLFLKGWVNGKRGCHGSPVLSHTAVGLILSVFLYLISKKYI